MRKDKVLKIVISVIIVVVAALLLSSCDWDNSDGVDAAGKYYVDTSVDQLVFPAESVALVNADGSTYQHIIRFVDKEYENVCYFAKDVGVCTPILVLDKRDK